jgi:uncharacterized protein (TIGR00369 family)
VRLEAWYAECMPRMTIEELVQFMDEQFPQANRNVRFTQLGEDSLECRLPYRDDYLRPGGTISGPALMALADTGAYWLILAMIGPVALAVTTSLNINFMRRPVPDEMVAKARMLKLGRQLAVVDIQIEAASTGLLVAQATVTYSIPPGSSPASE